MRKICNLKFLSIYLNYAYDVLPKFIFYHLFYQSHSTDNSNNSIVKGDNGIDYSYNRANRHNRHNRHNRFNKFNKGNSYFNNLILRSTDIAFRNNIGLNIFLVNFKESRGFASNAILLKNNDLNNLNNLIDNSSLNRVTQEVYGNSLASGQGSFESDINNNVFNSKLQDLNVKLNRLRHSTIINRKNKNVLKVVNKKIKEIESVKVSILGAKDGGFYSYNKYKCILGSLIELLNMEKLTYIIKNKFLVQLKPSDPYACLINIQYISNHQGSIKGVSPMKSFVVTGNANPELVSFKILQGLQEAYNNYDMSDEGIIVSIHWRE